MRVFTEYSTSSRDLRVLPSFAAPVPRLTPRFDPKGPEERYEVVIAGVGFQSSGGKALANIFPGRTGRTLPQRPPRTIRSDRRVPSLHRLETNGLEVWSGRWLTTAHTRSPEELGFGRGNSY
jgi:hypothetical protein